MNQGNLKSKLGFFNFIIRVICKIKRTEAHIGMSARKESDH